ncbi:DUF4200 domain-containing protein [Caenorhabditis elegans]|uniref:DUF4200 domain-containing protein n=1 Tax=Caenorhabditis elegans TaxID=6239 RepID=Q17730_CAEEL|nr:DUF4200 domain-containing protein [Caenorhabditis elegans]CCD63343.1 DUF4200 domain-containing protein [Caenorhabditis elegans]|eukprot:NP_501160.2 Uncharacterized protein CELE_C06E4.8 [Caenorhabditis elegans]
MSKQQLPNKETIAELRRQIGKQRKHYEQLIKNVRAKHCKEKEELEKSLSDLYDKFIEKLKYLMELNALDKENGKLVDMVFEISRNWTQINTLFAEFFGMNETLKIIEENGDMYGHLTEIIKNRMMVKSKIIIALYEDTKKIVLELLKSIESFLDFYVLGMDENHRIGMIKMLNLMKNVPFAVLNEKERIDGTIDEIKKTVTEIESELLRLPLSNLRPRRSIRQILWEEVDLYEAIRTGTVFALEGIHLTGEAQPKSS